MERNVKLAGSAVAALLACANFAQADVTDAQVRNLENRVSALEQRKGASGMINPSGRPQVKDGADVFFTADALIWQARENGLGFAISQTNSNSTLDDSDVLDLHYKWDFGFRVGMGWNTPHDGWDLYANWTWFQDKASRHHHAPVGGVLYPSYPAVSSFGSRLPTAQVVHAHWRLHLNVIDLEMGREFFVSKWLTLRPFVGLRTGWIRQKLDVDYEALVGLNAINVDMTNNYWGLGLRPGLNTQWGLGAGFSFFGNAAFSLLYGFFDLSHDQVNTATNFAQTTIIDNSQGYHTAKPIAEFQLGVRWETMFANDHAHFSLQAGWENWILFSQNQFKRFSDDAAQGMFVANQGDLTLQGITVSARIDF